MATASRSPRSRCPGQVKYNLTRRQVLVGADAVIFVADSQIARFDENLESFESLDREPRGQRARPGDHSARDAIQQARHARDHVGAAARARVLTPRRSELRDRGDDRARRLPRLRHGCARDARQRRQPLPARRATRARASCSRGICAASRTEGRKAASPVSSSKPSVSDGFFHRGGTRRAGQKPEDAAALKNAQPIPLSADLPTMSPRASA